LRALGKRIEKIPRQYLFYWSCKMTRIHQSYDESNTTAGATEGCWVCTLFQHVVEASMVNQWYSAWSTEYMYLAST
jgi:hypothetical protein